MSPSSIVPRLLISAVVLQAACFHGAPDAPPSNTAPTSPTAPPAPAEAHACTVPTATQRVTRSTAYGDAYEATLAFDGEVNSQWISAPAGGPAWIATVGPDAQRPVTGYALHFSNGTLTSRAPRDWHFLGWDGQRWNVLDQRTAETQWLGKERRTYALAKPGTYAAYCLHVTDDNDERPGVVVISLGSLELQ